MPYKITGLILSGGKSSRMGKNKAFIEIGGTPIIHRIHSLFEKLFQEVIIVTNQRDLFSDLDSKIYSDIIPNRGALGGLYTGLFFSSYPFCFCVACDMPFLNELVIEYLIKSIDHYDVVVPRTEDGLEPLHAIYSKNCLETIKGVMEKGIYKIVDFYPLVKVKVIDQVQFTALDPMKKAFINVNTPEELLLIKNGSKTV
jgi:molybdenum cofactor guanylyltransferase